MVIKKEFNCIKDVVDDALSIDCDFGISFITKYDNAVIVLKELFKDGELTPFLINISDESYDGYNKEYIISVSNDGNVFCEKFYRKDRYIMPDDGINYVFKDCTDECISHLYKYKDCIFIDTDFDDDISSFDDGFVKDCHAISCLDRNSIVTGFITSTFRS